MIISHSGARDAKFYSGLGLIIQAIRALNRINYGLKQTPKSQNLMQ